MKILQLCKKFPYPLKDGESIAVTYLSKAMSEQGCNISLLAMNTTKHYTEVEDLPESFNHYTNIYTTALDNQISAFGAFKNLFSKESYHVSRFICDDFKNKLIEVLEKEDFDIVQLETMYLTSYIPIIKKHSKAIVTMRAHNVEFEIWDRISSNTKFLPKKWYLQYLTKKLKRFELDHLNDYDYLIAVSDRDLKEFKKHGYKNGAMASPIGLDIKKYTNKHKNQNGISFIGALDWLPNLEGLDWFLENVWPKVHQANPDLQFHIAGRNTPDRILNLNIPQVVVHGEVPDAIDFIDKYPVMVVPLFSGSGMRVKILEGMALSKILVTTSLGKEGIEAKHEEHMLIADQADTFTKNILDAVTLANEGNLIGKNAHEFVLNYYDHSSIAKKLLDKYHTLLSDTRYKVIS